MKCYILVDIPDDTDIKTLRANFEVYGDIRIKPYYQSNYRFEEGVKLKPMPTKKKPLFDPDHCEIEKEIKIVHEIIGYNRCIDEIMGETDDETVKSA